MAAPTDEFAFDPEMMERAAQRWREREAEREHNLRLIAQGRYDEAEPKTRLAKRANRLLERVREVMPAAAEAMPEDLRELVDRGPFAEEEINNALFERIIGATRDFLSIDFLERGFRVNRRVGRIVTPLGAGRNSFGTGFLVSPQLLLTNWHVFKISQLAAASKIEFDYQFGADGRSLVPVRFALEPDRFFLNNKELDFALVAVRPRADDGTALSEYGWCPLIADEGKITKGACVNIIQHPRGEMKQVVIRENRLVDLPDRFAQYEGDTEPGSSGSPVFNDLWEVVALHHSGVPKVDRDGNYLDVDGNIWRQGDDPARLAWTANEGIRISRLVEFITNAQIKPHEEALRRELLGAGSPPIPDSLPEFRASRPVEAEIPVPPARSNEGSSSMSSSVKVSNGVVTLTIPLTLTVSLGTPVLDTEDVAGASGMSTRSGGFVENDAPDPDYTNRRGYNPSFLGFSVPLPRLMPSIKNQAFKLRDGSNELKYFHYSVILNEARLLAFVSAVNFDANAPFKQKREGKDKWFVDPRVPKSKQTGEALYAGNPLDRGHLTRRADAGWGQSAEEAELANNDTFHFTNCSPQHEVFNQSTKADAKGMILWGNLEEHAAEQARKNKKKLTIFNGPIFRSDDPVHRGVKIPREFWKVIVFQKDDGKPTAVGFILSQESLIKSLPAEEFEVGPYKPFQVRIRDLENQTKLDFGSLRNLDPLENEANESFFEEGTEIVPLESAADIRF